MHDTEVLCQCIGYNFQSAELLRTALTHRSFSADNNERLEFLGDSLLNLFIAEALYQRFADFSEGDLSRARASLVSGKTLAVVGAEFGLGDYLRLGSGETNSGGRRRESIIADAVEAIIGAIYLDAGMASCQERVVSWFATRLNKLTSADDFKDAKTRLQELLQSRKQSLPDYELVKTEGADHQQLFTVSCSVGLLATTMSASGSSRRKAEQAVAQLILEKIEDYT